MDSSHIAVFVVVVVVIIIILLLLLVLAGGHLLKKPAISLHHFSDLKRRSLKLYWRGRPNKKNNNKSNYKNKMS